MSEKASKLDFNKFKEGISAICRFVQEKNFKLGHTSKVNLTMFLNSNQMQTELDLISSQWSENLPMEEFLKENLGEIKIPDLIRSLNMDGINCNDFGIEWKFPKPKKEEPYIPSKSTNKSRNRKHESIPLITQVKNFISDNYEIRLDEVRNVIEQRNSDGTEPYKSDDRFEANLIVELLEHGYKGISNIVKVLLASDFVPRYHPIRKYIESLPEWDGKDRISQLASCLKVDPEYQADLITNFKKHLIRCVATLYMPDYFNKHCFVIVGTKQSMFKTSFIRFLCPPGLRQRYSTDAVLEWRDKDANIALGSNWIINLDELANLNRDETNSLKATLSRDWIKVRRPYDKNTSEIPRLANFFGSTNDLQFLTDLTGNVRWICFRVHEIDKEYNKVDIDMLWSQVFFEFENSKPYELNRDELKSNDLRNQNFMVTSQELEAVQRYLIPGSKNVPLAEYNSLPKFATSSELLAKIREKTGINFRSSRLFGQALQAANFNRVSERDRRTRQPVKGYWYHEIESEIE